MYRVSFGRDRYFFIDTYHTAMSLADQREVEGNFSWTQNSGIKRWTSRRRLRVIINWKSSREYSDRLTVARVRQVSSSAYREATVRETKRETRVTRSYWRIFARHSLKNQNCDIKNEQWKRNHLGIYVNTMTVMRIQRVSYCTIILSQQRRVVLEIIINNL